MNPFIVLDVDPGCSDEEVRTAYHSLIRRYPPESFPDEFQLIQEAAAALKTERMRWHEFLFRRPPTEASPMECLEKFARLPGRQKPPGQPAFQSLLRACAASARKTAS